MILLVEDEEDVRFMLKTNLEDHGFHVLVASEGLGAIKHLIENPGIKTILTDVRMPLFGGDYWLRFLKLFCADRYRVILQTGMPMDEVPTSMCVIQKPYIMEDLLQLFEE